MAKLSLLFSFFLIFSNSSFAQTATDTLNNKKDTSILRSKGTADSAGKPALTDSIFLKKDSIALIDSNRLAFRNGKSYHAGALSSYRKILGNNSWYNFTGKAVTEKIRIRLVSSYDGIFYLLFGLFLYFAILKIIFGKYLANLFTLFFRLSMRQQQIREQVMQAPLPSLLLNLLFLLSGGLYACFLIRYYHMAEGIDFWLLYIDCSALLGLLYLLKLLVLKATGWIFNITQATDTYIFIVFLANKILGIFLLPFLIFLSFPDSIMKDISITASLAIVFIFFLYRFIVSFAPVRKEIKVSGFHFFLYLCAFEIAPLLLIYKVLLTYLEKAY